jgi:hypothetical protein
MASSSSRDRPRIHSRSDKEVGMRLVLAVALVLVPLGWPHAAQAQDPHDVLEKAIRAHGGAERLAKLRAGKTTSNGSIELPMVGGPVIFHQIAWFQEPDRVKSVMTMKLQSGDTTIITVLNGSKGWLRQGGNTTEMDAASLKHAQEELHVAGIHRLLQLRDRSTYFLATLEDKVTIPLEIRDGAAAQNRRAIRIKVLSREHPEVLLDFDEETGLLIRTTRKVHHPRAKDPTNPFTEEKTLEHYQRQNGIEVPRHARIMINDGLFMNLTVTAIEFREKFDDSLFAKP